MARRLEQLLKNTRTRGYFPEEVSYVIPFLLRFRGRSETERVLAALRRDPDRLPSTELAWVRSNAPELLGPE